MSKVLIFVVLCAVGTDRRHVRAQQNIMEQGKIAVIGAIAKGKEVIDHGVNVKSERQQSYDIFGLKFDTSNGVGTGFGDAATEKNLNSVEDDLVRRRKRSLDVLEALRAAGLISNSAGGTNVNIVKINSVSNVNNYGPETTTESSTRRRRLIGNFHRSMVFSVMDQKVSYVSSDTELHKNELFKSHTEGESHSNHLEKMEEKEVDGPGIRNRRSLRIDTVDESQGPIKKDHLMQNDDQQLFGSPKIKRSLVLSNLENKAFYFTRRAEAKADGSMKTHTFTGSREAKLSKLSFEPESEGQRRAKRSPQEMDEGTVTTDLPPRNRTRPGPPDGDGGGPPSGRPRGPPPDCGGGGPKGGRKGKGRGPPPPPSEESDEDQPNDAAQRKKRETSGDEVSNESNSSYYSDSSSSEEHTGQRRRKREINANSGDENGTGTDSGDSSASSYYSDSSSSEYSDSTSEEDQDSESNDGGEDTQDETPGNEDDVQRTKRSPCKRSTTLPPDELERRKREAESQEDAGEKVEKDVAWFSDVMNKFFRAVKKVADTAKQVFSGGKGETGGEGNPDAERM
ncbi:dentin sialophosphoprotein-like [Ochlerotatus camptorhynchus]|uniref:dentin sialophosphoprotein-like n=1 Tax=Ochlerotatus camptorhynchus TaxID=644619 RepID=UPI0031D8EF90